MVAKKVSGAGDASSKSNTTPSDSDLMTGPNDPVLEATQDESIRSILTEKMYATVKVFKAIDSGVKAWLRVDLKPREILSTLIGLLRSSNLLWRFHTRTTLSASSAEKVAPDFPHDHLALSNVHTMFDEAPINSDLLSKSKQVPALGEELDDPSTQWRELQVTFDQQKRGCEQELEHKLRRQQDQHKQEYAALQQQQEIQHDFEATKLKQEYNDRYDQGQRQHKQELSDQKQQFDEELAKLQKQHEAMHVQLEQKHVDSLAQQQQQHGTDLDREKQQLDAKLDREQQKHRRHEAELLKREEKLSNELKCQQQQHDQELSLQKEHLINLQQQNEDYRKTNACLIRSSSHTTIRYAEALKRSILWLRVRPHLEDDEELDITYRCDKGKELVIRESVIAANGVPRTEQKKYKADEIFSPDESNGLICECIQPLVHAFLCGRNINIFLDGQSGSGKTYSLWEGRQRNYGSLLSTVAETIVNNVHFIFGGKKPTLEYAVKEVTGIATERCLLNWTELKDLTGFEQIMACAMHNRKVCQTSQNAASTRGHTIFEFRLTTVASYSSTPVSRLFTLVDMAGAEEAVQDSSYRGFDKDHEFIRTSRSSVHTLLRSRGKSSATNCTVSWPLHHVASE